MKTFKKPYQFLISFLHGVVIFLLLCYINDTSYTTSVDEGLLKKIFIVEDLIFPRKSKLPYDFVFINTSKDISLVKDSKSNGYITITDRNKLADFFKLLSDSNNQHKYILCDIFFDYSSDADTALEKQISRCKNIIFPFHMKENSLQYSKISVPAALADYETYNGVFTKFKLMYKDTVKTIPLVLHEQLDSVKKQAYFFKLNSFSPRYYIRPFQLVSSQDYPYYNLGDLLLLLSKNNFLYSSFLNGKFIIIGNFETDTHTTPIGKMYGPLVLIDSYLSIRNGRNLLSYGWLFFMLISLTAVSYILFFVKIEPPKVSVSIWIDFIISNFLNKLFSFLTICSLIVFISEILFSIQVTISPLFLYLVYVNWAISFYKEKIKKIK